VNNEQESKGLGETVDSLTAAKKVLEDKSAQHGAKVCTLKGELPDPAYAGLGSAPQPVDPNTGMHKDYYILCDEERAKGFVQPVRTAYKHLKCGSVTYMGIKLAETYARDPKFYGATFCCACGSHFPLFTVDGNQFVWVVDGETTDIPVGEQP